MCDSPGDRPCNSGFVKGWRLVAKGVLPGSLRRFRLAALRLRQVLKLQLVDHVCWTMGGQVGRAGLRAERFVEQDYERGGWKALGY
ncbi:hypothetical protein DEO72_LG3g2475 [Vigna unguiculata]|uniref:Uncharacterized protein n=1 Tax=Vigna unguiculata TaxID=3917 RepID=A0A4D6LHX2_VIGUN|nr:hypothetical protein DEO72_LG3g2475 [Vigna unguiculata]